MYLEQKQKIDSLVKEYESKISDCDKLIQDYTSQIRLSRHGASDSAYTIEELAHERRIQDTRRQCFIQFIKDLENLV